MKIFYLLKRLRVLLIFFFKYTTSDIDITSGFDTNFLPISFCHLPLFIYSFVFLLTSKNIFKNSFSPLCDGYQKRLVSHMEWPAEINLEFWLSFDNFFLQKKTPIALYYYNNFFLKKIWTFQFHNNWRS